MSDTVTRSQLFYDNPADHLDLDAKVDFHGERAQLKTFNRALALLRPYPEEDGPFLWGEGTDASDLMVYTRRAIELRANAGNDFVLTGAHDDYAQLGEGNDVFRSIGGNNVVYGDGGHDRIATGAGRDTIGGDRGDDDLDGGGARNVFLFRAGDGHDVLRTGRVDGDNMLQFDGATVGVGDLAFAYENGDLVVANTASGDTVRIENGATPTVRDHFFVNVVQDGRTRFTLNGSDMDRIIQAMAASPVSTRAGMTEQGEGALRGAVDLIQAVNGLFAPSWS